MPVPKRTPKKNPRVSAKKIMQRRGLKRLLLFAANSQIL